MLEPMALCAQLERRPIENFGLVFLIAAVEVGQIAIQIFQVRRARRLGSKLQGRLVVLDGARELSLLLQSNASLKEGLERLLGGLPVGRRWKDHTGRYHRHAQLQY